MSNYVVPTTKEGLVAAYKTGAGAALIASSTSVLLYGVSVCWLCRYWTNYKKDHWVLRSSVAASLAADSLSTLATFLAVCRFTVQHNDNPFVIIERIWNWPAVAFSTSLSAMITHAYLAIRLHKLVQKSWLTAFLAIIVLAAFSVGMFIAKTTTDYSIALIPALPHFRFPFITWTSLMMACHLLLCFTMLYHLTKLSKSQYVHTKTAMQRLTRLALGTEMFSVALITALIVTYYTSPFAAVPLYLNLGRLYTLTLLLKLNVRRIHLDSKSDKGDALVVPESSELSEGPVRILGDTFLALPERVYTGPSEKSPAQDLSQVKAVVVYRLECSLQDMNDTEVSLFNVLANGPPREVVKVENLAHFLPRFLRD